MASSSLPAPAPDVVALFGPTASGKTAVAERLISLLDARAISADSAALYAGLPILTAAPPYATELVGVVPLSEGVSVGGYQRLAHAAIDDAVAAGKRALVVGGTGLYLRAALSELQLAPPPLPGERERWERTYSELGPARAHALLAERDPAAAARVHANDRKRVVRALELSARQESLAPERDDLWSGDFRRPTLLVALDVPLEELDRRIEAPDRASRVTRRRRRGEARVGGAAVCDRDEGPRARGVRDAPRGRSCGSDDGRDEATRSLPAQVAPAASRRRYARRRSSPRGDRR